MTKNDGSKNIMYAIIDKSEDRITGVFDFLNLPSNIKEHPEEHNNDDLIEVTLENVDEILNTYEINFIKRNKIRLSICNYKEDIPEHIIIDVRQNLNLEASDKSHDAIIRRMPRKELLSRYLEWNNLINYSNFVIDVVNSIYNIDLEEIAEEGGDF